MERERERGIGREGERESEVVGSANIFEEKHEELQTKKKI